MLQLAINRSRTALRAALAVVLPAAVLLTTPARRVAAQADPCPEPNNGFNNACFIGRDVPTVQGVISEPGDSDAYRFEVAGPLAQVHVELTNLPADYDLHLLDGDAAVLAESTNQGRAPDVIDLALLRGTYVVFVNSASGQFNPTAPYTLTVQVTPADGPPPGLAGDTCPEPNDAPQQACEVPPGRPVFGALSGPKDVDSYRFQVAEADSYVTFRLGDAPDDFRATLLDGGGGVLTRGDASGSWIQRLEAGAYVIQVSRKGGEPGPGPYALLITVTPPLQAPVATRADSCPEPNNSTDNACPLANEATVQGFISTPSDTDLYGFDVVGAKAWVHAELSGLPADYDLAIQDENLKTVQASVNRGAFPEALDLDLKPGHYFAQVYTNVGQASNEQPYTLHLSIVPLDGVARPSGNVLFADTFNDPGAHFSATSQNEDRYEVGYYDGEYVVTLHHPGSLDGSQSGEEQGGADLKDFQLDLDARVTRLPQKFGGFSVSFRMPDAGSGYTLDVDPVNDGGPGETKLSKWQNGQISNLQDWVVTPAIRTGSQTNHVTIRATGSTIAVAINGQPVLSVQDASFGQGDIALGAMTWDQPTEARFDNLVVTPLR